MQIRHKPYGPYEAVIKPILDRMLALIFVLLFWWLYIILAILVRVKLGTPVIFAQNRPGKRDKRTGERIGASIIDKIADLSNDIWGNAKVDTYRSNSAWCENMVFVDNFL